LCGFVSATFGAGVNATHCPITCPKRRIQPERYNLSDWWYMTSEEKYEYWLDLANYDLKSANAMYSKGRWLYVVFMCVNKL